MPQASSQNRLIARPIHVADLLEGTRTTSDIYSADGHLLVAKGHILTPEVKIKIAKRRGFEMVSASAKKEREDAVETQQDEDSAAQELLDSLDANLAAAIENQRQRQRRRLRAKLEVRLLNSAQSPIVKVWARDLSEQGIGFISRTRVTADQVEIKLGKLTVTGVIVRRGMLTDGFWEYGVRFLGRLEKA